MFNRFTDRARKIMALANQEAQRFKHEYIGTEHVLLGLLMEDSGVGTTVLKNLDVDVPRLLREVRKLVKAGPDIITMGKLPQTPRAKKVIEYAIAEADSLNHNYVGSEHILLGMVRESEGIAAQVLMNVGVRLENVRQEILNLLGGEAPDDWGTKIRRKVTSREYAYAMRFMHHPLVKQYIHVIQEYEDQQEKHVRKGDYKRAAALRDEGDKMVKQLEKICQILRSDPTYGSPVEDVILQFCTEITCNKRFSVREDIVGVATRCLMEKEAVVLVGPKGSGRNSVSQFVSQELCRVSIKEGILPMHLIAPSHIAISESKIDGGYLATVLSIVDAMKDSGNYVLYVPELHVCTDMSTCAQEIVSAWSVVITGCLDHKIPLLASTTAEGEGVLQSAMPGFMEKARNMRVPELAKEKLRMVIEDRMREIRQRTQVKFEKAFASNLITQRLRWRRHCDLADPGLAIDLLEKVVKYHQELSFREGQGQYAATATAELEEHRKRLRELVGRENFPGAIEVMKQIEGIKRTSIDAMKAMVPGEIPCVRTNELLEKADGRQT